MGKNCVWICVANCSCFARFEAVFWQKNRGKVKGKTWEIIKKALDFRTDDPSFGRKFVAYCFQFFSVLILFVLSLSISVELIDYIGASDCYDLTGALICFFLVEFLDAIIDIPKQALVYACYTTYGSVEREERDILLDNDDVDSFSFD